MKILGKRLTGSIITGVSDLRTNSPSAPLAEYTTLYSTTSAGQMAEMAVMPSPEQLSRMGPGCAGLFLFMLDSGCRCSEALDVQVSDISILGAVAIRGKKGSSTRLINASFSRYYLLDCRRKKIKPFSGISYDFFYRNLKKFGVFLKFGNNRNSSVTHYFRHLQVLISQDLNFTIEESSQFIGHKSLKSTKFYVKKSKR